MQIAIAGAGLVGRLLGWRLSQHGHEVTLYESAPAEAPQSAAHVAAAMLAPLSELPDATAEVYELGLRSLALWPAILTELDVPFGMSGPIFVAHGSDAALLDKFQRSVTRKGALTPRWLNPTELADCEPELAASFGRALLLPEEGWLDNRKLLTALEARCGEIHYGCAVDPADLAGDCVIDCRGSGSDDPGLRSVRGEVIRVSAPEVGLTRPVRLMHPRYQIYIVPRPGHEFVIGATQIESSDTTGMSVRSALELLSAAFTVHSGFAEAEIVEMNVGLRSAYADHQPRVHWRDRVLSVNGLYRHGFLVAPALIEDVQEELATEGARPACSALLTANQ